MRDIRDYFIKTKELLECVKCNIANNITISASIVTQLEALLATVGKMDRIKGSADYTRVIAYEPLTDNVITITHTGTTSQGIEQITETISYVDATINGSNVTGVVYS